MSLASVLNGRVGGGAQGRIVGQGGRPRMSRGSEQELLMFNKEG